MKFTPEEIDKFCALVGVGKFAAGTLLGPVAGPAVAAFIGSWGGYKKSQDQRSVKDVLELLSERVDSLSVFPSG